MGLLWDPYDDGYLVPPDPVGDDAEWERQYDRYQASITACVAADLEPDELDVAECASVDALSWTADMNETAVERATSHVAVMAVRSEHYLRER